MDELILTLLKENGRIIIPDFGALLVKQKSPLTVIFNEFLQYNDGALIGAVATKLNIDRDSAAQKVKELTTEFQDKLSKGERIALKEIGFLTKSSTGKISLVGKDDSNQEQSKPIPAHTVVKDEKVKTVEFELEPETKSDTNSFVKPAEKAPVEKPVQKPVEKPVEKAQPINKPLTEKKPVQPTATTAYTSPIKKTETQINKPKETVTERKTDVNSTLKPPVTQNTYYPEPVKNKKSIFLWVLIILIVNGGIIGYFLYGDQIKQYIQDKKAQPKSEEIVTKKPAPVEQPVEGAVSEEPATEMNFDETQTEPEINNTDNQQFSGTKYYVVAGVFREESNADKLVKELRNKGYNAEKFGRIGSSFAVSYDVFRTKQEADNFKQKIKNDIDNEAWIKVVE